MNSQRKRDVLLTMVTVAILTSAAWLLYVHLLRKVQRHHEVSTIIAPMSALISDLNETASRGDQESLARKLRALEEKWEDYRLGRDRPDGFWSSIVEMQANDTEQAEPRAGADGEDAAAQP